MPTREVATYQVRGDDGSADVLEVWRASADEGPVCGPSQPPRTRLRTLDGLHVRRLAKGLYRAVESGVVLRSDDPQAP